MTWHATVTWRPENPIMEDRLITIVEALPGFGMVVADGQSVRAELDVDAGTLRLAGEVALRDARAAYTRATGRNDPPISLHVVDGLEYERQNSRPAPAQLCGLREAANLLGVSTQRVDQLWRSHPDFPAPIAQLAAGPVFTRASLEAVRERGWRRPGGRPRKGNGQSTGTT